jgi:glyoxylase-like metal-dependent hydrolase (beta-lactamase superfamily II)
MRVKLIAVVLVAAAATVFAQVSPGQQIVNDAMNAVGGRDRIQAVKTLVMEGEATTWNIGQDVNIDATGQTFTMTGYRRAMDLTAGKDRTEQTRTPNFTYFAGQAPVRLIAGLDGPIAYNVAANGTATRAADTVARDRSREMLYQPLTILRAALDPAATFTNVRSSNGQRLVDIKTAGGVVLTLAIDGATKLPARVVTMVDNANLGDLAIETSFADYQDVNGLRLPAKITTRTGKLRTAEVRVAKYTLDSNPPDLSAPPAAASAAAIPAPPPVVVQVTELGKGVWMLGPTYNGIVVEFADHLTLIEGLQNEGRALAVIAKARELRPGKPLTEVVNSHYHFDHSGGVRAAVAEGLTVITQKANTQYYRDVVFRKHTIAPDALARQPKPLKLKVVDDALMLKDATMTVNIYRLSMPAHVDAMQMAYIPSERLLIEADAYNLNSTVQPFASILVDTVKRLGLSVDRVVPIHGTVVPYSDIVKSVQGAPTVAALPGR